MKDLIKNVCICVISGFATQVGVILAQELYCKYSDKKIHANPIGFQIR